MIRNGSVKVNGAVAQIGDSVDPKKDTVLVKGKKVMTQRTMRYILLNKPRGYVTTTDDDLGRKCVLELVKDVKERIYPVGRLDRVSEGALILTNDGELTNRLTHPKNNMNKTNQKVIITLLDDYIPIRPHRSISEIKSYMDGSKKSVPDGISTVDYIRQLREEA